MAVTLLAALALSAWGHYRLWRVREGAGDYLADLRPRSDLADDEVNGSDLLDAVSALTRVATAEAGGSWDGAAETDAFDQAARLIRRHSTTSRASIDTQAPEQLSQLFAEARGLLAIKLLGQRSVKALEQSDRGEYLRLVNDQLAVAEWMLQESTLPIARSAGLTAVARVLAGVGAEAATALVDAPSELRRRLARLGQLDVAESMRAERAYALAVTPMPRGGGIAGAIARLPGTFAWPDSDADHVEAVSALAGWLEDPPYQRSEPPPGSRAPWVLDSLREMAAEMEVSLVQIQVAAAAMDYLRACAAQPVCPASPSVRVGQEVLAVDPFTGDSWHWLPRGEDCVFYSVGPDGRDDGGRLFVSGSITEPGIDIGWILPCGETTPDWLDPT